MPATDLIECPKCGRRTTRIAMGRHAPVCRADEGLKVCSRCGEAKPFEQFHRAKTFDGYEPRCRQCKADMAAAPEARAAHRESKRRQYERHGEELRARTRQYNQGVLEEIRERLGGKCVVCRATEPLEIDHVNDDGVEHRHLYPNSNTYYRAIRDELRAGGPLSFELQLLCRKHHGDKRRIETLERKAAELRKGLVGVA